MTTNTMKVILIVTLMGGTASAVLDHLFDFHYDPREAMKKEDLWNGTRDGKEDRDSRDDDRKSDDSGGHSDLGQDLDRMA